MEKVDRFKRNIFKKHFIKEKKKIYDNFLYL